MPLRFKSGDGSGTRTLPGTLFHSAETGDLQALQAYVQQGLQQDSYASVTLQQQDAIQVRGGALLHLLSEARVASCM